jgi:hypothetical protein
MMAQVTEYFIGLSVSAGKRTCCCACSSSLLSSLFSSLFLLFLLLLLLLLFELRASCYHLSRSTGPRIFFLRVVRVTMRLNFYAVETRTAVSHSTSGGSAVV